MTITIAEAWFCLKEAEVEIKYNQKYLKYHEDLLNQYKDEIMFWNTIINFGEFKQTYQYRAKIEENKKNCEERSQLIRHFVEQLQHWQNYKKYILENIPMDYKCPECNCQVEAKLEHISPIGAMCDLHQVCADMGHRHGCSI